MGRSAFALIVIALITTIGFVWHAKGGGPGGDEGDKEAKKPVMSPLPIRQVVLFNSGVGYFQREGDVEGASQIDLTFPTTDVNDLLKSLVLQDLGGGQIRTVSYDSHDPVERTLQSFALDLTGNPTFGQILNQARGEKVLLLVKGEGKEAPPAKLQGTIVGMEVKRRPVGDGKQVQEMDTLNLAGPNGLQAVHLEEVLGVRFLNPTLENEFQRALAVLASAHDVQKKTVSLNFGGAGKRAVRVGYVVERPIWRTTYRLRIEPNGKLFLQGWALVENPSDDDWNEVRVALVSGKPISFEMNLYEPLYVPRPLVEPELFASLRPPVYDGAMAPAGFGGGGFGGGIGGFVGGQVSGSFSGGRITSGVNAGAAGAAPQTPVSQGGPADIGPPQANENQLRLNPYQLNLRGTNAAAQNRLTYDELQRRRKEEGDAKEEAKTNGPALAGLNFKEGIASVATAGEIGNYYQYVIDQKISLSRQKSAMLPILDQHVEGTKVSIFNDEVHAKHPLLGLRLKNTSGRPLTQGPITVYDNHTYAGDTRVLDLQPQEERLISYALDLGTEVKSETKSTPSPEMNLRLGEPSLTARYLMRRTKTYTIRNRSTHDRTVVVEHPIASDWKLLEPKTPEKTRSHYRFTLTVAAGKTSTLMVAEEQPCVDHATLAGMSYAPNVGVEVKMQVHAAAPRLVGLKIQRGFIMPTFKVRESRTYHIQNVSDEDRSFAVEHVIRKDWSRLDAQGDPQPGPGTYAFALKVAKGKTGSTEVIEERTYMDETYPITVVADSKVREYLNHAAPSAEVKAVLTKTLTLKNQWAVAAKQAADQEKNLTILSTDQARLRENLKIVPQNSDAYKKFLDKFVTQESEIESLQKSIRQAQAVAAAAQAEYQAYVSDLNAE